MNTFVTFELLAPMKILKTLFDFYINSSIHVALAVCGLCGVTFLQQGLRFELIFFAFIFFATITGYNFVKYAGIAKLHHVRLTNSLKAIQVFSLLSFCALVFIIFYMPKQLLLAVCLLGMLTLLYALPIFPKERNLRAVSGLKVYIIAVVWACVAGLLPYLYFELRLPLEAFIHTCQFFVFVLAIILPFEIRDLNYDTLNLGTIPQSIGIKKTKIIGVFLLVLMLLLQFFKNGFDVRSTVIMTIIVIAAMILLICSKKNQGTYYSSFWVESLPICWLILLYFFKVMCLA